MDFQLKGDTTVVEGIHVDTSSIVDASVVDPTLLPSGLPSLEFRSLHNPSMSLAPIKTVSPSLVDSSSLQQTQNGNNSQRDEVIVLNGLVSFYWI
jgi:hypothetical protein